MSMYKKTSTDTMLDTINSENVIVVNPLSLTNVGFGIPQEITTPGALQNARVRLYSIMRQGYQGTVDVEYQRLSLSHLFLNQTLLVQYSNARVLSDILPAFNLAYGTNLTKDDIVDVPVSDLGDDYIATVQTQAGCLMWSGSVDVRVVKSRPKLSDIVKNQALDIVKEPFPSTGKRRMEYVGYGYDFIEIASQLRTYNGKVADTDLVDMINGVVDLKLTYKPKGSVAIGDINLLSGRCVSVDNGLEIRNIDNDDFIGSLTISWIPEV